MFFQLGRSPGEGIIGTRIGHDLLQGFRIPTALHCRQFGKGSNLRPATTLGEDLLSYFDFSQSEVPVELFFLAIHLRLGVVLRFLLRLLTAVPTVKTSFPIWRNSSIIRLSASAAFSPSPPAFSIMASMLSILAFSSGYSFSLSSKLGG
jgi:hypothetical protein